MREEIMRAITEASAEVEAGWSADDTYVTGYVGDMADKIMEVLGFTGNPPG